MDSAALRVDLMGMATELVTWVCWAKSSWKRAVQAMPPVVRLYLAKKAGLAPHQSWGPKATFRPVRLFLPATSKPTGASPL